MAAQDCTRAIGNEYCVFHPEQKLIFECTNCPRELVCISCVTSIHQSHTFVDIKQSVQENLQKISSFIQHSKEKLLPDVVNEIKLTISKLQETKHMCQNEIIEVKKQEDRLKELVDVYSATKISRLEYLFKETTDVLNRHKVYLEKLQEDVEKNTKEYQQTVKAGTDVLLYDTRTQIEIQPANKTLPKVPEVTISNFFPCKDPQPLIQKAFGELKEEIASKDTSKDKSTPKDRQKLQVSPKYSLLREPKILYKSCTSYGDASNSICRAPNNHAWLLESSYGFGSNNHLHCFDNKGNEPRTLKTDVILCSICTDPTNGDIYCIVYPSLLFQRDYSIRCVNTETGQTSIMFTTDIAPYFIGCTNDKHFVVNTEDNTVRKYRFNGQVVRTYNYTGPRVPDISVCSSNNNIALIYNNGEVTVLDQSLQQLYAYRGQGLQQAFRPHTASFDGKYLLVGNGDSILVLDGGKLVHTVITKEMSDVRAICVLEHGEFLVGCDKKVLCIKYME